jgi:hypothetical protein
MPTAVILDYVFNDTRVANPDGTFVSQLPATAEIVAGPGNFNGQNLEKAANFLHSGPLEVNTSSYFIAGTSQFHVRVVFKYVPRLQSPLHPGRGRQVLVESDQIPFTLFLTSRIPKLATSVKDAAVGFRETEVFAVPEIVPEKWYLAELVWDKDTLFTFLDGNAISCHGFGPSAAILVGNPQVIRIGGSRRTGNPLSLQGHIASVKVELGIPDPNPGQNLPLKLNQMRDSPQWYITTKLEKIRPVHDLGAPLAAPVPPSMGGSSAHIQLYTNGQISFTHIGQNPPTSQAYAIWGDFWNAYQTYSDELKAGLGHQTSDEFPFTEGTNIVGRTLTFDNGILDWSQATGAYAIYGRIWRAWKTSGSHQKWGLPLQNQQAEVGGVSQRFQLGTWYNKGGAEASGVHNAINVEYIRAGGIAKLGWPLGPEQKVTGVMVELFGTIVEMENVVRQDFESGASIFSQPVISPRVVYTDFMQKYREINGPGVLGLPITDRTNYTLDPPGSKPRWTQGFQKGLMAWNPSLNIVQVFRNFRLRLVEIAAVPDGGEKKDMYMTISIFEDRPFGNMVYNGRFPPLPPGATEAYYPDQDTVSVNERLPPVLRVTASKIYYVNAKVMDDDDPVGPFPNEDDLVGETTLTQSLGKDFHP